MAYRLEPHEPLSEGLKRVAAEELESAHKGLTGDGERDKAVHEARKSFKKLRAVLRLVRSDLGGKRYRDLNTRFRDAGRELSALRDAEVLVRTLGALEAHFTDQVCASTFSGVRKVLEKRQREAAKGMNRKLKGVAQTVAAAQGEVAGWPIGDGWSSVSPNLGRVYERGAAAFEEAYESPSDEGFHEWRKCVKDLWYHLRLLNPLWPPVMTALAEEAGRLSDLLGEEHDLAVLGQTLTEDPAAFDPTEVEALLALIEGRRKHLRDEAEPLGRRFYVESPKRFVRRLGAYWEAWQGSRVLQN